MKNRLVEYLYHYGFSTSDVSILSLRCGGSLETAGDIRLLLDSYEYDSSWEQEYVVQSAICSCSGETLSCINAAILAYTLLGAIPGYKRLLLAIHRRNPEGVECGHIVALGEYQKKIYALGKSNYSALSRVYGPYDDRQAAAMAFGQAYVSMRFTPLYFGFFDPKDMFLNEEYVVSREPINAVVDFMISNYQFAFDLKPIEA